MKKLWQFRIFREALKGLEKLQQIAAACVGYLSPKLAASFAVKKEFLVHRRKHSPSVNKGENLKKSILGDKAKLLNC